MTDQTQVLNVEKEEVAAAEETERTRQARCFVPRADIYETEGEILLVLDVPGVEPDQLDITLEKEILTVNGYGRAEPIRDGYSLLLQEYEPGDYQRSFRISDQVDRDKIGAVVRDGVLRLRLPKAEAARARRISVSTG